jgi:DnaJ-class molecular chaperone
METELCRDCAGRGHALELVWDHCTDCDGTGEIEYNGRLFECEDCYGKGTIRHYKPGETCSYCNGSGMKQK